MKKNKPDKSGKLITSKTMPILISIILFIFGSGCVASGGGGYNFMDSFGIERSVGSYEAEGLRWGKKHWADGKNRLQANSIDNTFVSELAEPERLDFFWVHSELKDAFKKGYRLGYQDRTADLVLGPHLTEAAVYIGKKIGERFVGTIETFEEEWAVSIKKAVDIFITLISEGSQNDREKFVTMFTEIYNNKYQKTQKILRDGTVVTQVSEGGTLLFLDYRQGKMLGALNIPETGSLKTELYTQAFNVMGDELGRRFSTNLIKRDELVDLLRRSKTALQETPVSQPDINARLRHNMRTIHDSFVKKYGTDAENVFRGLIKDAGYPEDMLAVAAKHTIPGKKR